MTLGIAMTTQEEGTSLIFGLTVELPGLQFSQVNLRIKPPFQIYYMYSCILKSVNDAAQCNMHGVSHIPISETFVVIHDINNQTN